MTTKKFWLIAAHVAVVAGGAYISYTHGTPLALIVSAAVNTLMPSPLSTESLSQNATAGSGK